MFALIKFSKSEYFVYPKNVITKCDLQNCIVKTSGGRYIGEIAAFHGKC